MPVTAAIAAASHWITGNVDTKNETAVLPTVVVAKVCWMSWICIVLGVVGVAKDDYALGAISSISTE